jgi:CRISPR-associated endonuclease Csn1
MIILGLDAGIASLGWAIIELNHEDKDDGEGKIIACGTRMFDSPEEKSQTGTSLKSATRREKRGQRRVIRRRRQRMNQIRDLFHEKGLLLSKASNALAGNGLSPWALRVKGLEKPLTAQELALALGHIARHRGFKSNAKGGKGNEADESTKMKKAMSGTRAKLMEYGGNPSALLMQDDEFLVHKDNPKDETRRLRNREGDYSRTLLRDDLENEVKAIFKTQRRFLVDYASQELEEAFRTIAFTQRPLQDSENLLGFCPFEPKEKRASKSSPSFELFRFTSKLNTLTLYENKVSRRLTLDEIQKACENFGQSAKISFKALRGLIGLDEAVRFEGVHLEDEIKDVVARTGEAAKGTYKLRKIITENAGLTTWLNLQKTPETLDKIVSTIAFREDLGNIAKGLQALNLDVTLEMALLKACENGECDSFAGAAHISALACRNIIPHLKEGLTYDKACEKAGYRHTDSLSQQAFDVGITGKQALKKILSEERISPALVGSPTARKALIEAVKQVKALVEEFGIPDKIHVEVARDVGKSIEERNDIERGIEKRNKERDKTKLLFEQDMGRPVQQGGKGREELLKYELWREQKGYCLYTNQYITPSFLIAEENLVQVDHILPFSRFGDDSFVNKTVCFTNANQQKRGQTPYEWFKASKSDSEWEGFAGRVEALKMVKGQQGGVKGMKIRNYLLKNADEVAGKFRNRNLNDTRWICSLLGEALAPLYPVSKERRIFMRAGAITNRLRQAWGLQWIKKDEKGERIPDDRHHALDAVIVAATTEGQLQRLTKQFQKGEEIGDVRDFRAFNEPYKGFRNEVIESVEKVFVSRAERRRARGEAHAATVYSFSEREGVQVVYERKRLDKNFTEKELARIKDPERNQATIDAIQAWFDAGKSSEAMPKSPKGDIISKLTLITNRKVSIPKNTGSEDNLATVERGGMVRVDVFKKANKKGVFQYYLVPIYAHEVATLKEPPMRAVTQAKLENEWALIDETYQFLWSINQLSYLEIVKSDGVFIEGYYRGLDRATGNISISPNTTLTLTIKSIGVKTLHSFKKYTVNRLGEKHEILKEQRTWRGAVCISPKSQD